MSFCYVAISAEIESAEHALFALCPEFYIMDRQPQLNSFVQMYGYCASRSGYLNGLHPSDVKAFCQHQGWCLIIDFSLSLPERDDVIVSLSKEFGTVVTAVTQGTSGSACFSLYENGELKRRITSDKGNITSEGEPLESEIKSDANTFYITELDRLWQSFGLPPYLSRPSGPYTAVHYLDNSEERVEKDIEGIAERTRQYEELEAMKARYKEQTPAQKDLAQITTGPLPTETQPAAAGSDVVAVAAVSSEIQAAGVSSDVVTDADLSSELPAAGESSDVIAPSTTNAEAGEGDDLEETEKAEKPKDKPWWKLW